VSPPPRNTDSPARADQAQSRASVLAGGYRRLTLGLVTAVLLVAFEAMAVATAMPVAWAAGS
jgi:hypothetical protein